LFLRPIDEGREIDIPFSEEKDMTVRLLAVGRLLEGGEREVFWEVNGKPRLLTVEDRNSTVVVGDGVHRAKATDAPGSVGAPMSGVVIEFKVEVGSNVKAGAPLCVLSAMKMETTITAPIAGVVDCLHAAPLENVTSGDLLVTIEPSV
jgi:pyruvate carboxylase